MTFADASTYEGDWVDGVIEGSGTHTYVDAQGKYYGTYVGEFSGNMRDGSGTYTYASGYVQSGQWQDGNFLGSAD
jgi:hypothetical protein